MNPPRVIRRAIVLAIAGALLVQDAWACECAARNICELIEQSEVIFLGEVVDGGLNSGEDAWSGRPTSAKLRIVEAYRGLPAGTREITVTLSYMPGMCSPAVYRRGERTLAFLRKPDNGTLQDGACSGSRFAKDDPSSVQYVREYFAGRTTTTIRGKVAANTSPSLAAFVLSSNEGTPVAAAQIKAEGRDGSYTGSTNARGEYTISGLTAGTYRVTAAKTGYSNADASNYPQSSSFQVSVRAKGCAIRDLGLWTQNSLQGVIRDAAGKPVMGVTVFLQKVGINDRYGDEDVTNDRGEFEFKNIDPRRYYLVVSPFGATADSPYKPGFYGGASSRERAQTIPIDATSNLRRMDIQLGARLPTRRVRVIPEFPDRSRASDTFIVCGDAQIKQGSMLLFASAKPDRDGVPSCVVLSDRPYVIRLTGFLSIFGPLQDTPEVRLPAGDNDIEVKLLIGPKDAAAARRGK